MYEKCGMCGKESLFGDVCDDCCQGRAWDMGLSDTVSEAYLERQDELDYIKPK
jgi:hypothetical protein|tara:strand:+ start:49 stop:207 length:159 start_codon:yes stop_codon:yes gene_type:complete